METTREYKKYGLVVVLDKEEVFLDNPGNGTPAMVYKLNQWGEKTHSATFWCAMGEDELQPDYVMFPKCSVLHLTESQSNWLSRIAFGIDDFLYG